MAKNDKKYSSEEQAARTRAAEVGRGKSTESAINVKNPMSSAKGPYQILDSTWKDLEKMSGKKLDRKSPEDNELAFQLYTKRSEQELEKNGLEVNPGNTYALHVYGPKGGVSFLKKIKSNPEGLAIDGMSKEVINGNKPFFFDESGKPRTNISAYNKLSSRVGGPDDPGAITLAKNIEHQQVQQQQQQDALAQQQVQQAQQIQGPNQQQEEQAIAPEQVSEQEMQAPEQPVDETSQLSRASNKAKIVYSGDRLRDGKFILPKEPIQEDIKTSGESVQKIKSFSLGGISDSRKKTTPEQQLAGKKKLEELGANPSEKPFENREVFDTKKIVKYQPGVTSGNNQGFYLYSKDPVEGGFNPDRDREFIKQSEMMDVQRTPQWSEYLKVTAEKNARNKAITSLSTNNQFVDGGDITLKGDNDGLLNDFNTGGSHEENPNGGIFQGIASDGVPNTVEEGETKMGNYVFSNRLSLDKKDVENLYLPRETEGMTYADASKFINNFLEENPFDFIIKRTVTEQLESLKVGNDRARRYKEEEDSLIAENEIKKEINNNPELQDEVLMAEVIPSQNAFGGYLKNRYENGTVLDLSENKIKETGTGPEAGAYVQAATGAVSMGMEAFQKFDSSNAQGPDIEKVGVGGAMAKGAVSGASAGMAFGPWGAAIGGVIGGGLGLIGASRQNKAANKQSINKSDYNFNMLAEEDESIAKYGGMQRKYDGGGSLKNSLSKYMKKENKEDDKNLIVEDYLKGIDPIKGEPILTKNEDVNFKMKGTSPFSYAEGVGSLANYLSSRKEKPRHIQSEQLTKLTTPKYYDESYLQTQLGKEANNVQQAAMATSGGSAASARAMTLAGMNNLNKLRGESYFKMDEVNRGVYNADQAESQRIADANVGLRNNDYQANLQEQDYVQGRKELARDNMIKSFGNFGREQNDKNLLFNLTGGYNTDGTYDPEQKKGLWNQGMDYLRQRNNREHGGLIDAYDKAMTPTAQELAIAQLKKKYNG